MISRIAYPRRRGRKPLAALAIAGLVAGTLFAGSVAFASGTGVTGVGYFQLDGDASSATNPLNPSATSGDDWDHVWLGTTNGADATTWTSDNLLGDGASLQATLFTGGGSKDPQEISNWAWKDGAGGLPDKDNLQHAFAARYGNYLYFGSDRYDNSGDAQQGFWFFQNKIDLTTATKSGGGYGFTGLHRAGDVLVISDFSNGGTTSTITVYQWDPLCTATNKPDADCGDANLRRLATSDAANCRLVGGNAPYCGIVNASDGTIAPWPFFDKTSISAAHPANTYLQGELYEAGIDLGSLGLGNECFSSIGAETRSSTSTTATLKDFILGSFSQCGASLDTTASGGGQIGANGQKTISDTATILVTGLPNPPKPTGSMSFWLCGPEASSFTSCTISGTATKVVDLSAAVSDGTSYSITTGDVTVSSAGYYCWAASWPGDTNYSPSPATAFTHSDADECVHITPVQPSLTTVSSTTGDIVPGTNVHDTVNFDPAPAAPSTGASDGTVTFKLYGPYTSVAAATCGEAETPAFTDSKTVQTGTVSYTSGDYSAGTPGYYTWRASYTPGTGDKNNLTYTAGCTESNEQFRVLQFNPDMTTGQTVTIKDSATITVSGGGDLAGQAHFRPYSTADCSAGTELAAQQDVDVSGVSPQTASTTPITFTTTQSSIYWNVWYTSTNTAQTGIDASCTENASITIDNGN